MQAVAEHVYPPTTIYFYILLKRRENVLRFYAVRPFRPCSSLSTGATIY